MTTFIENQEANIAKVEEKRGEIAQLLKRGEKLEGQADCPDFLKEQVKGLSELFKDSEEKAKKKLETLKRQCSRQMFILFRYMNMLYLVNICT